MAERVEDFPDGGYSYRKYPWEKWMDGSVWACTQGQDFDCKVTSFVVVAKQAASKSGRRVRTKTQGDTVYLQFTEKGGVP